MTSLLIPPVLALLCISFLLGFIGGMLSYCGLCKKWLTIPWAICSLLSLLLAVIGVFLFYINYQALNSRRVVYQYHTLERYVGFKMGWIDVF